MASSFHSHARSLASAEVSLGTLCKQRNLTKPLDKASSAQSNVQSSVQSGTKGATDSFVPKSTNSRHASGSENVSEVSNSTNDNTNNVSKLADDKLETSPSRQEAFTTDEKFELLSAFLDDYVTDEERQLVLHWLQTDATLQKSYQQQQILKKALRSLNADLH